MDCSYHYVLALVEESSTRHRWGHATSLTLSVFALDARATHIALGPPLGQQTGGANLLGNDIVRMIIRENRMLLARSNWGLEGFR